MQFPIFRSGSVPRNLLAAMLLGALIQPAVAAQYMGFVSVTGGNIAHFEDLNAQFPAYFYNQVTGYKGTYPTPSDCAFGVGGPTDYCFSGSTSGPSPIGAFGPQNLDQLLYSGAGFGSSGVEPSNFYITWQTTTGDAIYATFSRLTVGNWTSPLAPSAAPEPVTWAMMMLGLGATGYVMRRRRVSLASV